MVTSTRKIFNPLSLGVNMQIKLLKDVVISVVGANGNKIVDLLFEKKNVNEFLIAKKLNLTINQTRNILYKLADEGLVSFIRKKDSKKGGWYTYFWTLNSGKSLVKFKETLLRMKGELEFKINLRRSGRFFYCNNCNLEFDEENALLHTYSCPECGEPLQLRDNTDEINSIQKEIEKLTTIIAEVDSDLLLIGAVEQKVRDRKMKAELKKKENERLLRKQVKMKETEKLKKIKTFVKKPKVKK
jgi:transcription factor E